MKTVAYKFGIFISFFLFSSLSFGADLAKKGPQIRIAVAQFGATDRFVAEYGGWNIGGGLAAQLVTSLIESGRVVVVERAVLSKVLMEQELSQNRLSSALTQVSSGQLLGVDYLIVGEVTEFEERQMGAGGSFGIMKGIGPKVSSDVSAAHVGLDMRIIDTRTGQIISSYRAEGKAWGKAFGAKMGNALFEFGGEVFQKTPLGKATRRAITSAMDYVLSVVEKQIKDFTWLGRVIDVSGEYVYIDAGKLANVRVGDQLRLFNVEKVLTHPETNEILGLIENESGMAVATQVELKYTKARFQGGYRPSIGSLVRFGEKAKDEKPITISSSSYQVLE